MSAFEALSVTFVPEVPNSEDMLWISSLTCLLSVHFLHVVTRILLNLKKTYNYFSTILREIS